MTGGGAAVRGVAVLASPISLAHDGAVVSMPEDSAQG